MSEEKQLIVFDYKTPKPKALDIDDDHKDRNRHGDEAGLAEFKENIDNPASEENHRFFKSKLVRSNENSLQVPALISKEKRNSMQAVAQVRSNAKRRSSLGAYFKRELGVGRVARSSKVECFATEENHRRNSHTELMALDGPRLNSSISGNSTSPPAVSTTRTSSKTAFVAPIKKSPETRPRAYTCTRQKLACSRLDEMDWVSLTNLEQSYKCGMIKKDVYEKQKQRIIKSLTGTMIKPQQEARMRWCMNRATVEKRKLGGQCYDKVVPDWKTLPEVQAIRHSWNAETLTWTQDVRNVKIAPQPFDHGRMRSCYYMLELTDASEYMNILGTEEPTHVCKISLDPYEERITYFNDAAMQAEAQKFANLYNNMKLPKNVGFLEVSVYQIREGQWMPHRFFDGLCNVEEYIKGEYVKYTTNWDQQDMLHAKKGDNKNRSTPPTFSHFTYKTSGRKLVVVDMQGVGDLYTDPQMHTLDKKGFGKGNMGIEGIKKFVNTHVCTALCRHLKLEDLQKKQRRPEDYFMGTQPNTRFMTHESLPTYDASTQATNVPEEGFFFPPIVRPNPESIREESKFCNFGNCTLL